MVFRQHSRSDLSLLQHQSTSEEKHGRETVETAGRPFLQCQSAMTPKEAVSYDSKRETLDTRMFLCNIIQAAKRLRDPLLRYTIVASTENK